MPPPPVACEPVPPSEASWRTASSTRSQSSQSHHQSAVQRQQSSDGVHVPRTAGAAVQISEHVSLCEFTKEPFYVFERCKVIALPSTGKEGLPNVLLEALAMEKPCVATHAYGMPEVVVEVRARTPDRRTPATRAAASVLKSAAVRRVRLCQSAVQHEWSR
jgi:hypothetical protein